ncbi:DUF6682 family protein [Aromatoleum anaerobium]|uniref:Uncharacterized protein n=1 Tax=Aromatoleum anaerobium TaxID=182180 RepID=A0ABX1PNY1_9RHOO|nr:DUF6682 family protein [Aromatoleum anaerobium]MCK0507904.1 hypothetical protein [Aromatoleum anaerobium]
MKLGELLAIIRRDELDDESQPYLWSNAALIEYAEDAENEACRRASLLRDATTPAICRITLVAGTSEYDLDPRVIRLRRVRLTGNSTPLVPVTTAQLDEEHPGWEDETGEPSCYLTDWETGEIRVVPTPTAVGTLELQVVRLPLVALNDMEDTPEIHARFHRDLRHWIVKRAFSVLDSERQDKDRAKDAESRFALAFGDPLSARTEEWNARNLPSTHRDGSE